MTSHEDALAALLRSAGRRPAAPEDAARRVREAVREEWLNVAGHRTRNRRLATAAAALLVPPRAPAG